jgi:hypothetical protein
VVPDHGDIDICIDVSLVYCKLMEIYQRTFGALLALTGESHLELFVRWRQFWLIERNSNNLAGSKDYEIWTAFQNFVELQFSNGHPPLELAETFRFERCLREVSEGAPVERRNAPTQFPFMLSPRCRLFETSSPIDGWECTDEDTRRCLIFASQDRLHVLPIDNDTAELLDFACDAELAKHLSDNASAQIRTHLAELISMGVLISTDACSELRSVAAE